MRDYQSDQNMYAFLGDEHKPKHVRSLSNPNAHDIRGVQFSSLVSPDPSETELQFLEQMGVTHCYTWIQKNQANVPYLTKLKKQLRDHGLTLWNVGMLSVGKNPDIILGTKKRDAAIKEFLEFLHVLASVNIRITIFTWEPASALQTGMNIIRGGALGRFVDTSILSKLPNHFGRAYSEEELWENMSFFLNAVLPTAEQLGVILALHPNDPPSEKVFRGIPNLIRSSESFERVFALARQSPSLKMEFCCGCWLEGGGVMGNLLTCLREFIARDKVVVIHLRNVTSPLPKFTETFIDEGYGDIFEIVRTVVEAGYSNTIILDHTPLLAGGVGLETAFCAGYIKAMIRAAQVVVANKPRAKDLTVCLREKKVTSRL